MHVFADLQAYICTRSECPQGFTTFPSRRKWFEHEKTCHLTRHFFQCTQVRCDLIFETQERFLRHVHADHVNSLETPAIKWSLLDAASVSTLQPVEVLKCPLCQNADWTTYRKYEKHLGKHQEEIALCALPPCSDGDGEDEEGDQCASGSNLSVDTEESVVQGQHQEQNVPSDDIQPITTDDVLDDFSLPVPPQHYQGFPPPKWQTSSLEPIAEPSVGSVSESETWLNFKPPLINKGTGYPNKGTFAKEQIFKEKDPLAASGPGFDGNRMVDVPSQLQPHPPRLNEVTVQHGDNLTHTTREATEASVDYVPSLSRGDKLESDFPAILQRSTRKNSPVSQDDGKSDIETHGRANNPARFACELCPKRFTRQATLQTHLLTHANEKPFKCSKCERSFVLRSDRQRHERIHSIERKFICRGEVKHGVPGSKSWGCGMAFPRADALESHFRSETGRMCLQPLREEEELERKWHVQTEHRKALGFELPMPKRLVDLYPELGGEDGKDVQDQKASEKMILRNDLGEAQLRQFMEGEDAKGRAAL